LFAVEFMRSMSERMSRAFAGDALEPGQPAQLMSTQIRIFIQMIPALSAGAVVISFLLFALTAGTDLFPFVAAWSIALHVLTFLNMCAWLRARRKEQPATAKALRRSVTRNLFYGMLWGALPVALFPQATPGIALTVAAGTTGVLCAAGLSLLILPQAALALATPVLAGTLWTILEPATAAEGGVLLIMMITFAGIAASLGSPLGGRLAQRLGDESKIREQQNIISLLLREYEENSSDWLWEFGADGRIGRASRRFCEASSQTVGRLNGRDFCEFLRSGSKDVAPMDEIEAHIASQTTFRNIEIAFMRDGQERHWRLAGKPVYNELGQYAGYVGTASDITMEKLAQSRIQFLAHNDTLTGLLNRESFSGHLKQSVTLLERYGTPFTILYLDLDQFKSVNDSRGHLAGDKLLAEVSRRLSAALRAGDVAARIGGDEFAVILNDNCDSWSTATLAARLVETISKPYEIDGETLNVGLSIGIALAPANGIRPDQLLRNADLALYRAKAEGRGVYRFFEAQMDAEARERRVLEIEMRQALLDGEFALHYQPLVSAESGLPTGFEALIRWNHPIRGLISPAEFIPIAEETGLILPIGDWAIRTACFAAAAWPEHLNVAINLSVKQFETSDIAAVVQGALAESRLAPHRLELEITEGLLIRNPDQVVAKLREIKALGVTVAIDDFGTGYSSLSSLLKFPFDRIKIDRSFVTASSEGSAARDVLRLITALGTTLNMRITAEGVETREQVEFLRQIACHTFQGYYFAKPLEPTGLASYLLGPARNGFPEAQDEDVSALESGTISGRAAVQRQVA
jgi:diguanylate cyclase (GGDEF)-like protein/PAS domain S-box-containing protein